MKRYDSVDAYVSGSPVWRCELKRLREILLTTELAETIKWGAPCYTLNGKNVVGLAAFQSYFGLWFFQGALLADSEKVLVNAQEGKTKALRQWRFTSKREIKVRVILAYVQEAIDLQQQGHVIKPERVQTNELPKELLTALKRDKQAQTSFDQLTPGRQREYADYIGDTKRPDTKQRRITKILPMIVAGQGLNDQYR